MYGIVSHIKEEWLPWVAAVQSMDSLSGQSLGNKNIGTVVFFQSRNGKWRRLSPIFFISIVFFTQITG